VEIFCYLRFGEYICIIFGDPEIFMNLSVCSAAMLCNMIFMHV
jgi:hypothetical protein